MHFLFLFFSLRSLQSFRTNQSLFSGQTIEAKTHDDVTMLFSDIVGFTSICSTATPMMVINMLEDLYNQFDAFCGQLDVYKVRLNTKLFFDFRLPRDVNELCDLPGYYSAQGGDSLPTFRDNLSDLSSRVHKSKKNEKSAA